jgi:hypothetical protein
MTPLQKLYDELCELCTSRRIKTSAGTPTEGRAAADIELADTPTADISAAAADAASGSVSSTKKNAPFVRSGISKRWCLSIVLVCLGTIFVVLAMLRQGGTEYSSNSEGDSPTKTAAISSNTDQFVVDCMHNYCR